MTDKEYTFDRVLLANGFVGRHPHENEPNQSLKMFYAQVIAGIINQCEAFRRHAACVGTFPEVFAGIASCTSINGCAFRSGDIFYVGLCRGTFELLAEAFRRLLSMPTVFPEIGDASKEVPDRNFPPLPRDSLSLPFDQRFLPNDPVRYSASAWMMIVALDFLIQHEFRHLQGGHADYAYHRLNGRMLTEATQRGPHRKVI